MSKPRLASQVQKQRLLASWLRDAPGHWQSAVPRNVLYADALAVAAHVQIASYLFEGIFALMGRWTVYNIYWAYSQSLTVRICTRPLSHRIHSNSTRYYAVACMLVLLPGVYVIYCVEG